MPYNQRLVFGAVRYLAGKALTILIAIFVGVFATVLLANQPSRRGLGPPVSPFETSLEAQIDLVVRSSIYSGVIGLDQHGVPDASQVAALTEKLRNEVGLNLPFLPRYLLWTYKALTFDWGQLGSRQGGLTMYSQSRAGAEDIILHYLPNTLLLMGTAYFLVLLIGVPLSLMLARRQGSRLDRLFSALSPISSVPSWVFGILLLTIFAFELHWLPFGKMFDFNTPTNPVDYAWTLIKHMILPVSAIVLSLLFQMVYAWRTFFIIYGSEDYVDLAYAKGLPSKQLERQYILRPALPYVLTSFATSLVSFWQLNMALEVIFQWPGLGWLYIKEALPSFWGESMEPGELIIVVGVVVIFAYILGAVVFILDFTYVLIDPRIHLLSQSDAAQSPGHIKTGGGNWITRWLARRRKVWDFEPQVRVPVKKRPFSWLRTVERLQKSLLDFRKKAGAFFQELRHYPSAVFGLVVIVILFAGSVYAVTAMPYDQVGRDYNLSGRTGRVDKPRRAAPAWTNWFNRTPYLSTIILDDQSQGTSVSKQTLENGWIEKTTTFTFDYPYQEIPSEIYLYFDPTYSVKVPFVSLQWTFPDGRTLALKPTTVGASTSYDFESAINVVQLLNANPAWKSWFVQTGNYQTPAFNLLFQQPGLSQPAPQHGRYQVAVKSLLFEPDSDVRSQLVLLGQVYGPAGTDFSRRDLVVPLFWGMPFALLIGLLGSLITTVVALLLPAIGVWFGGWMDHLVQRLSEVNMVLPGLSIAVLTNVLFGINIWIILTIVIVINALGSPIKTLRSALLQAKEAPYIETARAYGAGDFRIITRYLVPRILPVLIPQLVIQVPSFIFWEATLGFFNIQSTYPSWGHIIYDGLSQGAIYGSPFWVLEPISLLLLTSLAFAMLGSALERILNPRMLDVVPVAVSGSETVKPAATGRKQFPLSLNWRTFAVPIVLLTLVVIVVLSNPGKTLFRSVLPSSAQITSGEVIPTQVPASAVPASPTIPPTPVPQASATPTLVVTPSPTLPPPTAVGSISAAPAAYILHAGEFPYCIARRYNVNPTELLALNGFARDQTFFAGMVVQIPQTGNPFPGQRMLQLHPGQYAVTGAYETFYSIACVYGDLEPSLIAQANGISVDSALAVGQVLIIP